MHRKEILSCLFITILVTAVMVVCGGLADRGTDYYAAFKENESSVCIVIDAGHGGVDGGAVSCTGVYESGINLEIALKLNDLLHLLGYKTLMIRTEDISVYTNGTSIAEKKISDLKERVRIINSLDNPLVVSIHQNYYTDGRYGGAQVFYADEGIQLAKLTQKLFVSTVNPGSNRKSKKAAGIYLMEKIKCAGILIECGFLSNPQEEYKLRSEEYQKQICCIIASALSQYINNQAIT